MVELFGRKAQAVPFVPAFQQLLAAFQQQLGIVPFFRGKPGLRFDPGRQRAGQKAGQKHDEKSHRVAGVVGLKGKPRHRKKEVEGRHTEQRSHGPVPMAFRPHRRDQNPQNINRNAVGLAETGAVKGKTYHRCRRQHHQHPCKIPPGKPEICLMQMLSAGPVPDVQRLMIGDDIDIQIRQFDQTVCQGFFARPRIGPVVHTPHHDLGNARNPGILRNLDRRVCTADGCDLRTQLFCQTQIAAQPLNIFPRKFFCVRRFHKQCRKPAMEGFGHAGRSADHLGIGRRRGKADQNMLPCPGGLPFSFLHRCAVQPVGGAAHGDLPQSRKICSARRACPAW